MCNIVACIIPKNIHNVCTYCTYMYILDLTSRIVILLQCQRLSSGLTKILEASEQLSVLNEKLEVQKVAVTEKSMACNVLLEDIQSKTSQANEKKELAEKKSIEIEEQNKVIAVEKVNLLKCYIRT